MIIVEGMTLISNMQFKEITDCLNLSMLNYVSAPNLILLPSTTVLMGADIIIGILWRRRNLALA